MLVHWQIYNKLDRKTLNQLLPVKAYLKLQIDKIVDNDTRSFG